jgi:hypothetical protein
MIECGLTTERDVDVLDARDRTVVLHPRDIDVERAGDLDVRVELEQSRPRRPGDGERLALAACHGARVDGQRAARAEHELELDRRARWLQSGVLREVRQHRLLGVEFDLIRIEPLQPSAPTRVRMRMACMAEHQRKR